MRLFGFLPLPVVFGFGVLIGEISYWAHAKRRMVTRRNLTACFPRLSQKQIRRLARKHLHYLLGATFASTVAWWGSRARLLRLTKVHNFNLIQDAQARGKNVILLTPHFVGLEYIAIYLSAITPLVSMYQPSKNPLIDLFIRRHRARFGMRLYPRTRLRKSMLELIRGGTPFYYLPDQDPGHRHRTNAVFAPFYRIPTATFTALGGIARLTNACVIPCMARILPFGRGMEVTLYPPLDEITANDDPVAQATHMNRAIEKMINRAPEQYLWSHRRFKSRPPGEPKFYPHISSKFKFKFKAKPRAKPSQKSATGRNNAHGK